MTPVICNYRQFIAENFGAITIERTPAEKFMNEPDVKRPLALAFHTGGAGKLPAQWTNSPFLAGGTFGTGTNQFGSNPRIKKKKQENKRKVYSFQDFIETSKLSSKKQ